MSDNPVIAARLLFDPALVVVCACGRPMTVALREAGGPFGDEGPLDGSRGEAMVERRCEPCNVLVDIGMYA
ncbi:hypothetical protein [Paractinoplanes toevensis]|uniref:Uncharacterized protein n=1 Tax=Paractinoplanes toevensis TaxID=571911 RepID=A0A919W1S6_9ACTN|nr:hypothetical protein [Actinoplanes toevensis]GIM88760.1 hypothetical protein Ato02nite_005530 [Actinoplanes toevensis]